MNHQNKCILLFTILLLSLVFCSVLGGVCNREGFRSETGPRGNTAVNTPGAGGTVVNTSNNSYDNYNHFNGNTNTVVYYGPNKSTAKFEDNTVVINIDGKKEVYKVDSSSDSASVFHGPNGSAAIVTNNGETTIQLNPNGGDAIIFYPNNYRKNDNTNINDIDHYSGRNGSVTTVDGAYGNDAVAVTGPRGNTAVATDNNGLPGPKGNADYYPNMGIPRSAIPNGDEDLYILKSQVVIPVCPKCDCSAAYIMAREDKKCNPCPAPKRCPDPAFTCEKRPDYSKLNHNLVPIPMLNDFSKF